jgi:hypothetical protein
MEPPNIFPTHVALNAGPVPGRRRGSVIGIPLALTFAALCFVCDAVWLSCARLRQRVRARNLAREREIVALRQSVAREGRCGSPHPESGRTAVRPRQRCKDCRCLA